MHANDIKHLSKEHTLIKMNKKINLTINNKEVYALQRKLLSSYKKIESKPEVLPQPETTRVSLFNVIKKCSALNKKNRMITSCSPIKANEKDFIDNYIIHNPKIEKRNYSSTKEDIINRCHRTLDDEDAKIGTINIFKASLILKKKIKDRNYYVMVIQEYWRHYCKIKQNKKVQLFKKTKHLYYILIFIQKRFAFKLKKLLMRRLRFFKPVLYEVTANDYYLIQLLKEFNIKNVEQLHLVMKKTPQKTRTRQGIIKNNGNNNKKLFG